MSCDYQSFTKYDTHVHVVLSKFSFIFRTLLQILEKINNFCFCNLFFFKYQNFKNIPNFMHDLFTVSTQFKAGVIFEFSKILKHLVSKLLEVHQLENSDTKNHKF